MTEITHKACPNCSSSDAFAYNTVKMVGVCYSCGSSYPKKGKTYSQEILDTYPLDNNNNDSEPFVVEVASSNRNLKYYGIRGIADDVMEFYDVSTLMDANNKPLQQEYIYPSGSKKIRKLPKTFTATGRMDELFGMNLFVAGSSKYVTITEGELDALSAWQMIGRGSRYPTPVVSLPSANPSKAFWENIIPWLDSFEKIILSVDKDGAGDAVAQKINNIFPTKVYRVDHTLYKDANEFLQDGKASEYKSSWYNAQRFMPDNVLHSADDLLALFDEAEEHTFVPSGIKAFDDIAGGWMQGHFTVLKARTGIGKTELVRFIENNFLQRNVPFATMHLEETKLRSVLGLVSYDLKDNLTRKDLVEDKGKTKDVRESIKRLGDSEGYYQFFMKEGQGADELISQIRMFKEAYGCRFVMFEPIQDCLTGSSSGERESDLADLAVRLSKVAAELNVGIITVAHTNDDNEIKYCKYIGQRASVVVRLERDKDAEDIIDKNTTQLIIEKNRPTSEDGRAGEMLFDTRTFTMEVI